MTYVECAHELVTSSTCAVTDIEREARIKVGVGSIGSTQPYARLGPYPSPIHTISKVLFRFYRATLRVRAVYTSRQPVSVSDCNCNCKL